MSHMARIRNIGVIAHIDAGKTTLTERMLFYTRKIHRMGEVHNGTATMDYLPEEQERGITISSACTTCHWNEHEINIIDTPGHVDFTIEVERSLRVLDGAIGVFCAVGGVQPQSETVWRQSEQFKVPKIIFINKIDRVGADFAAVLHSLHNRLAVNTLLVTLPVGQGEDFSGIIDLITQERLHFTAEDQGQALVRSPLTADESALAAPWREKLLEKLAEADESFLDTYLAENFTIADVQAALRRVTIANTATPVLCGSALKNTGIQPVLDAVCAYLPSPLDVPALTGHDMAGKNHPIIASADAPLSALIFKVLVEGGRKLSFMRLYAGSIKEGENCRNISQKSDDRVGHIYRMHADRREQIPSASAGDIVALVGLRSALTGATYGAREHPVLLEPIAAYEPVITLALEPRNADEGSVLDEALTRFTTEDPTLFVRTEEGSGHRMVSGMGELHLDVLLERIKREYAISPRAGQPQVVCRETVLKTAEHTGIFDRELGKEHHFGSVSLSVAPQKRGTGNTVLLGTFVPVDPKEKAKLWPQVWLDAAVQGAQDCLQSGILNGYPVQDVRVCITGMERREGLSSPAGYHMAAGIALREALAAAQPVNLEPLMWVEISVPESFLGPAISLFSACSGKVENLSDQTGQKIVQGLAPMRQLFGFSTSLRSVTQGRAGLIMKFERFDTV
ncbi:MAG: elongation factor G [Desulfovibrionaceae bacterium]